MLLGIVSSILRAELLAAKIIIINFIISSLLFEIIIIIHLTMHNTSANE